MCCNRTQKFLLGVHAGMGHSFSMEGFPSGGDLSMMQQPPLGLNCPSPSLGPRASTPGSGWGSPTMGSPRQGPPAYLHSLRNSRSSAPGRCPVGMSNLGFAPGNLTMPSPCMGLGDMGPMGLAGEGPGSPMAAGSPFGLPQQLHEQQQGPGSPYPSNHLPPGMGSPHPMSPAQHGYPLGPPPALHGFGFGAGIHVGSAWDLPGMMNPEEMMGLPMLQGRMMDMSMQPGNPMGPLGALPTCMAPPPPPGAFSTAPLEAAAGPGNAAASAPRAISTAAAAAAPASDFVVQLQQLLNEPGGVDGHPMLIVLRDLLNGALPGMGEPPVDAASFLGMLREAAGHLAIPGAAEVFNPGSSAGIGAAGKGQGALGLRVGSGGGDGGEAGGDGGRRLAQLRLDRVSMGGRLSNDGSVSSSSCYSPARGSVAGAGRDLYASPRGMPQSPGCGPGLLLTPQEVSTARAALVLLLRSAYSMVHSDGFTFMCCQLAPLCEMYDSMHDMPVVMKRRKCKELGAMRDKVLQDAAFVQVSGAAIV